MILDCNYRPTKRPSRLRQGVIERYGSEPNITYFEKAIIVDNLAQTIEESAGA